MTDIDLDALAKTFVNLAEGNPGAMSVLAMIAMQTPDVDLAAVIHEIHDQQLTGAKLWVAYKDHCHESVDQLVTGIMAHSPGMKNTLFAEGFTDFEWKP